MLPSRVTLRSRRPSSRDMLFIDLALSVQHKFGQ